MIRWGKDNCMKETNLGTSGRLGGTIISDRVVAQLLEELRTGLHSRV